MTSLDAQIREESSFLKNSSFLKKIWNSLTKEAAPYLLAFSLAAGMGCGEDITSRPRLGNIIYSDGGGIINYDDTKTSYDTESGLPSDLGSNPADGSLPDSFTTKKENGWLQVSAGQYHACGIRGDGTITCWGNDESGQVSSPEGTFIEVSAGGDHTCGLKENGILECWGSNNLPSGKYAGQASPPLEIFTQVSAGGYHTCGMREGGSVECWGAYGWGECNAPSGTFAYFDAGNGHTCGMREGGSVECWGNNLVGQVNGSPGGNPIRCNPCFILGTFLQVSAGDGYNCGLKPDDTVECWGMECPMGICDDVPCEWGPAYSPFGIFSQISTGWNHACGIGTDSTVECWRACQDSERRDYTDPPSGTFTQISAGRRFTCGIRTGGSIECWGNNDYGQSTPPSP